MSEPWTCPVCRAGVAPWAERCDHGAASGEVLAGQGWPWPVAAQRPYVGQPWWGVVPPSGHDTAGGAITCGETVIP